MRRILKVIALAVLLCGLAVADESQPEPARQLCLIFSYVGADYGGAVAEGKVVDPAEYQEQLDFLGEARRLLAELPPRPQAAALAAGLDGLEARVRGLGPAGAVAAACKELEALVVEAYAVVTAPDSPPDPVVGAALYWRLCSSCHGVDGSADTEEARKLTPRPRPFQDPEVLAALSPVRAFNVMTFGLAGTGMASFKALPVRDRWNLAFHVYSFHHGPRTPAEKPAGLIEPGLAALSTRTDAELRAQLEAAGIEAGARDGALAWLRTRTPFAPPPEGELSARVAVLLGLIDEAERRAEAGDALRARDLALSAYFDGFEPLEPLFGARDPEGMRLAERQFLAWRQAIKDPAGAKARAEAALELRGTIRRLHERAAATDAGGVRAAAFVIILREGLEGFLLIAILLALLRSVGGQGLARQVHLGWILALVLGAACWWVSEQGMKLAGEWREGLEGSIALLAAAILFWVSRSIFSPTGAVAWVKAVSSQVGEGVAGRARVLVGASFLAVFREVFETILFLQALRLTRPGNEVAILQGCAAGILALVVVVVSGDRLGRRLPVRSLLSGSGLMLAVLGVVFVGSGLQALREAGWAPEVPLDLLAGLRIDLLGIYPDGFALAIQALLFMAFVVPSLRSASQAKAG